MVAGLAMHGHGDEAIALFHEMESSDIMPDGIIFISLLYAGWRYFCDMKNVYSIEPAIEHYGCMVDLYSRAGQLEKAYQFACQMPIPPMGNVLYDIEDEEKEDSISSHSEKLAVAFGIGRLCRGKMIRIVKNLRICKDCHVLMKLISQVYDVEIVVRDRSRFHTFKSGSCSCRDYW
ncbi:Pentatricopeptide repeat-containing protein At1g74630 [Linum grandiflorum]